MVLITKFQFRPNALYHDKSQSQILLTWPLLENSVHAKIDYQALSLQYIQLKNLTLVLIITVNSAIKRTSTNEDVKVVSVNIESYLFQSVQPPQTPRLPQPGFRASATFFPPLQQSGLSGRYWFIIFGIGVDFGAVISMSPPRRRTRDSRD